MADCSSSLMGEYVWGERNDKAGTQRQREGLKALRGGGVFKQGNDGNVNDFKRII